MVAAEELGLDVRPDLPLVALSYAAVAASSTTLTALSPGLLIRNVAVTDK